MKKLLERVVVIAILGAGAYVVLNWQSIGGSSDDIEVAASRACIDATEARFNVTRTKVYKTATNANGYTIRLNVTLANGEQAKVVCLATSQGSVRDVSIDVR